MTTAGTVFLRTCILLCASLTFLGGCTTLVPVDADSDALRQRLAAGDLVKAGDRVEITTVDGRRIDIRVVDVSATAISGKRTSVPISEIDAIRIREYSRGKTIGLTAGIAAVVYILYEFGRATADVYGGWQ